MKLLHAHIENFRLLRDVAMEFANGDTRNVTVIRAANESGKTTLLTALQWGLFGDEALPDFGRAYRLSPIDIPATQPTAVPISVEVDYEIPTRSGHMQKYRVIRSASETPRPGGTWERTRTMVNLFNLTPNGAAPLDNPEAHIRPQLPADLRIGHPAGHTQRRPLVGADSPRDAYPRQRIVECDHARGQLKKNANNPTTRT